MANKVLMIACLFVISFVVFATSGWLAQQIFVSTGCVWTSSVGFGASFVGIWGGISSIGLYVMDWTHWN